MVADQSGEHSFPVSGLGVPVVAESFGSLGQMRGVEVWAFGFAELDFSLRWQPVRMAGGTALLFCTPLLLFMFLLLFLLPVLANGFGRGFEGVRGFVFLPVFQVAAMPYRS